MKILIHLFWDWKGLLGGLGRNNRLAKSVKSLINIGLCACLRSIAEENVFWENGFGGGESLTSLGLFL